MSYDHDDEGVRATRPRFLTAAATNARRISGHDRHPIFAEPVEVFK